MDRNEQIKQMMENGMSDMQIAKIVHISRATLKSMRKSFGIACFKKLFVCDYDMLKSIASNVNSGISTLTEEAKKHNTNRVTLAKSLRKNGIEVREYRQHNPEWTNNYVLTDIQKQILIGDMLGDGGMVKTSENRAYYHCAQSIEQNEFVDWKFNMLSPLSSRKEEYVTNDGRYTRMGTFTCNALGELHKEFYPQKGYKVIPISFLKNLSPLGLAVWYMGDGSLNRNTGVITIGKQIENVYEVNEILNEKFNCKSIVKDYGKCYQIRFTDYMKFFGIVYPFLLESFTYKVSPAYLASIDNQQPSLDGNVLEGSSTRESLNCEDNTAIIPANLQQLTEIV